MTAVRFESVKYQKGEIEKTAKTGHSSNAGNCTSGEQTFKFIIIRKILWDLHFPLILVLLKFVDDTLHFQKEPDKND